MHEDTRLNVGQLKKTNRQTATKNMEVRINARMAVGAHGLIVCTHSKKIEEFNQTTKKSISKWKIQLYPSTQKCLVKILQFKKDSTQHHTQHSIQIEKMENVKTCFLPSACLA